MIAGGGLSGGISSTIAGGDFWQGMRQGLITSGLNHVLHMGADALDQEKKYLRDKGESVLDPKETLLGKIVNLLEPRIYTDPVTGVNYQVDANGQILRVEPIGGLGAMGLIGGVGGVKVSQIAGFYVRAKTALSGGTYTKTVQSLASLDEGTSLIKLVKTFETKARAAGAKRIVIKVGEIPSHLAALMQTNINVQRLTTEAILTENRDRIYHAALLDPHTAAVLSIDEIYSLVDELLTAHKDWLPTWINV